MLLNEGDFTYRTYKQNRGRDGVSGKLQIGTGRDGTRILVKKVDIDALNEYVGCNLGQLLGVNTPKAWLFDPETVKTEEFWHAVAIEYLDGLDESYRDFYDTESHMIQMIQCDLLHILVNDTDYDYSEKRPALYQGNLYTFDFGEGMFPRIAEEKMVRFWEDLTPEIVDGFSHRQSRFQGREGFEPEIRHALFKYVQWLNNEPIPTEVVSKAVDQLKDRFIEVYNGGKVLDMMAEIDAVYGEGTGKLLEDFFTAMQQAFISF